MAPLKPPGGGRRWLRRSRRQWWSVVARLLVSAGMIAALFVFLPASGILSAMRQVSPRLVGAVLLGFLAGHVLAAIKWRLLLSACGLTTKAGRVLRAHGAGLFANLCLPSLVGGDLLRTALAARPSGRIEVALVGTMADRLLDTMALGLLVAAAALFLPGSLTDTAAGVLVPVVALLLLAGLVAATLLFLEPGWLPTSLRERLAAARGALRALVGRPFVATTALLIALLVQAGFVALNIGLGRAVGLSLPLAAWFFLWPLAKLAALAPISLGGIGVREVAFAALVAPFGATPTLAVGQSLLWEVVLIAGGLGGGLFFVLSSPLVSAGEHEEARPS